MTHSTTSPVAVSAETIHGHVDGQRIDQWELKAARRALANLKELLYGPAMHQLLRTQIDEADRNLKRYLAESRGEFTQTQVVLQITGVNTAAYGPALPNALVAFEGSPDVLRDIALNAAFPMHPEHYALPDYPGVVETMGGLPTRSHVMVINDAPDFVTAHLDDSYPMQMTGAGELDDGTLFTYVLQQFKDTSTGMEANLRIWYPAACPPIYLEEHAEHYTVEFRNALTALAEKSITA